MLAKHIAIMPHITVNNFDIFKKCLSLLFLDIFLLYKSTVVVAANALSSDAVEDIAAQIITAINNPTNPLGK